MFRNNNKNNCSKRDKIILTPKKSFVDEFYIRDIDISQKFNHTSPPPKKS